MLKLKQNNLKISMVYIFSPVSSSCKKHIRVSHLTLWPVLVHSCVTTPPHSGACLRSLDPAYRPHSLDWGNSDSPSSLQTDVDPAHPSSLARPPSIMGFSKQGVSKRKTVGWDGASHNSIYRPLLASAPFLKCQLETYSQAKLNAI